MIVCNYSHYISHILSIKRMCGVIFIIYNVCVYFKDNSFSFCIVLKSLSSFTILSRAQAMLPGPTCFYSSTTLAFRYKEMSNRESLWLCFSKWSLSGLWPHPAQDQLSENGTYFEESFS